MGAATGWCRVTTLPKTVPTITLVPQITANTQRLTISDRHNQGTVDSDGNASAATRVEIASPSGVTGTALNPTTNDAPIVEPRRRNWQLNGRSRGKCAETPVAS